MATELLQVGLIIFFSFIGVIISARFKLPSIIGLLFFGSLIGPHALGLVQDSEIISLLFDIGAILLLFFLGIEFNMEKISHFGVRASFIMFFKFSIISLFTYLFSMLVGMGVVDALIMAAMLSFSSTAIFARLVAGTPQQGREETKMMSAVLILEDLFAIFLLTLIPQIGKSAEISVGAMLLPILISLAILFLFYVGLKRAISCLSLWIDEKNTEAQLFLALALCSILAFLSSSFGLSPSIGAFFAGSAVSSVSLFKKIEGTLEQLFILFSAFFFFAIGMQADPFFALASAAAIFLFSALNIALKFFSVSFAAYLAGFDTRGAFFSALIMLTVSEFALLIAHEASPISSFDLISFSSALLLISSITCAFFYPNEAALNSRFSSLMGHKNVSGQLKTLSMYLGQVFRQFEAGGDFYETFMDNFRGLVFNFGFLFIVNAAILFARIHIFPGEAVDLIGPFDVFEAAAILLSIYPAMRILAISSTLIGKFSDAFYIEGAENLRTRDKMAQDAMFAVFFFLIALGIPPFIQLLELPAFLQALFILPLAMSFIFIWDLALLSAELVKPFGPNAQKGRLSAEEFYMKLHKQRAEMRAKMHSREIETGTYLLAPISILWKTRKSGAGGGMRGTAGPFPSARANVPPQKQKGRAKEMYDPTLYNLLNPKNIVLAQRRREQRRRNPLEG
ncbi:MAG: cation:proton antiporter [Candidatus Bilamarchaeaceae archaeon]